MTLVFSLGAEVTMPSPLFKDASKGSPGGSQTDRLKAAEEIYQLHLLDRVDGRLRYPRISDHDGLALSPGDH
ncbi:MAG TPA: hypothetical protein EYQ50_24370 [Verrucomicrobiales bacterium]|nr:hypothetical protein [Verrucomicrobiales bacterium]